MGGFRKEEMPINKRIQGHLMPMARAIRVADVRIGLGYTSVLLENGQAGVAFTFNQDMKRGCTVFQGLHPLAGRQASELLAFLDSTDKIGKTVALATANALANKDREGLLEGDIFEHLHINSNDKVGMVGYFRPVVPRLKEKTSSILIFEQIKEKQNNLLPEEQAYRLLPECQVALITSTSILNHTVDKLLVAARLCRDVVLLGASTPIVPEAFKDTPVTFLSGIVITNPLNILRIVSEGAGMRLFRGNVKKVNIRLSF